MKSFKSHSVLPGFNLSLGFTVFYLVLIVLWPLSTLFTTTFSMSLADWQETLGSERVISAFRVSITTAFIAAVVNLVFGLLLAWVLARYEFPGKKIMDALVDLPFALPTAIAGIALASLYAPSGLIGKPLAELGFKVAFTPVGIVVALIFIGLPFVVRTVEPIIKDIDAELEDAAESLGASRLQVFWLVLLPNILPALMTGFAMALARGLGEYGSVIFIAGNMPMVSEIVPLIIVTRLEQFDYKGATALALVMLVLSFLMLFVINHLQRFGHRRFGVTGRE